MKNPFEKLLKKVKWKSFLKKTMVYVNKHMSEQQAETFQLFVKKIDKVHKLDWESEFPMLMMTVILAACKNLKEVREEYGRIKTDLEMFIVEMDKIVFGDLREVSTT